MWENIPKFEVQKIVLEGEKVLLESLINQEVAFFDINIFPSAFFEGDYASVQIEDADGNKKWFRTSSGVLITQLKELKDKKKLPIRSTIRKVKRYFTLS